MRKNLIVTAMALVFFLTFSISIWAENLIFPKQTTQISHQSMTNTSAISTRNSVEVKNESSKRRVYTIWSYDHNLEGFPKPAMIHSGELNPGKKHHFRPSYKLGRCTVTWSSDTTYNKKLGEWETPSPYRKNFRVGPGQKAIVSSNPDERTMIMDSI